MTDQTPPKGPNSNVPPPPPAGPPPSAPSSGGVSPNRKLFVVLSYLGLLALIPLLVEKDDREVQWHAKHGLVLTVVEFVAIIALWIVIMIVGAISGGLGCVLGLIWPVAMLGILILHIMCIVKGVNGERFLVPGISELTDRF
ncbi:MAG: hypothetical protein MUC56_04105 [Thermoanaerobaculales bacterium]|jgi:uncharacterized membrane protein|nr:hypothetical protein [Thermoanaerobaculales bacterium]